MDVRVLMFGWEYPPHVAGGLATATVGLVKGLIAANVDVTLVVPFPDAETAEPGLRIVSAAERIAVHRIESPLEPYADERRFAEILGEIGEHRPGAGALYGRDLLAEVERFCEAAADIARTEPHDVIDTHDWMTFPAGIAARAISRKPLVAHIHATEIDRQGEGADPRIMERERHGLEQADRVIANSQAIKEICVQRYEIPGDRIDVIHWGIDRDGFNTAESEAGPLRSVKTGRRPPTVLFLGRVTRQKGPDRFVEVAARVAEHVPDARFVLAGTGDLLPGLMHRAAELGVADRLFFTGKVTSDEAARLYALADVCLMPSVSEPFGLVALESALRGTPVIVPRSSGVAEVLRHALRVDFWDVDAMTDLVVSILRHAALKTELSDNVRMELAQPRFGLDEPAARTKAVYELVTA